KRTRGSPIDMVEPGKIVRKPNSCASRMLARSCHQSPTTFTNSASSAKSAASAAASAAFQASCQRVTISAGDSISGLHGWGGVGSLVQYGMISEEVPVPDPIDLAFPFTGRWLTQNSPADRAPSHGTDLFATAKAIDFVPVDERGRTAPMRVGSWLSPEPPDRFPGFGRPIYAPAGGVVVATHDSEPDHDAHRG